MSGSAIVPVLGALKWPLTLVGAFLVFGLSTEGTISLVANNAHLLTSPITARDDFNVAPVKQIGDIRPSKAATLAASIPTPSASISVSPAVAVEQPLAAQSTPNPIRTRPGRIGDSAVNLRSGPVKTASKLGVVAAGTVIQILARQTGWVKIRFAGGEGWIYSDYLAGGMISTRARNEYQAAELPRPRTVEIGSRMAVRADPQVAATVLFRLETGERVQILDRKGQWLKVATASGEAGWIRTR